MLKVVNIATNINGGAGRSAYRLHQSFVRTGIVDSTFLSLDTNLPQDAVNCYTFVDKPISFARKIFNKIDKKILKGRVSGNETRKRLLIQEQYGLLAKNLSCEISSLPFGKKDLLSEPVVKEADLINLHWVSRGFLDYPSFFKYCNKPIVWTLHDMNPFLGLFHYKQDEERNKERIGEFDNIVKEIKKSSLQSFKPALELVTPSLWLGKEAEKSEMFKGYNVNIIPYSLDHRVFKYKKNNIVREKLSIPDERIVLIFVAFSLEVYRKGFDLLFDALKQNAELPITVIAIGRVPKSLDWAGLDIKIIGIVNDNNVLADYYSAADAFILPSREDNLPNVMLEAFACGTPVIGFPVGGVKEYVVDKKTGILANDISSLALSEAIKAFVEHKNCFNRPDITKFASNLFNDDLQSTCYLTIYNRLLKN